MAAGTTTRGALQAFKNRIQDEDIVIIPANILTTLLENTLKHHEAMVQSQNKIGCAIEQLAQNLQNVRTPNEGEQFQSLLQKMDTLTSTIADSRLSSDASRTTDTETENVLHTYMETEEKMLQSRDLATYYDELLNGEIPYAPWKFRSKIRPTTPEFETQLWPMLQKQMYAVKSDSTKQEPST